MIFGVFFCPVCVVETTAREVNREHNGGGGEEEREKCRLLLLLFANMGRERFWELTHIFGNHYEHF